MNRFFTDKDVSFSGEDFIYRGKNKSLLDMERAVISIIKDTKELSEEVKKVIVLM
ncbi:MAG: hypothetical protein PHI66_01475 [Candidatus Pacebacteria bacterium]|nr:hypothetical protein [Candidatus Paceibacterota bacterium]